MSHATATLDAADTADAPSTTGETPAHPAAARDLRATEHRLPADADLDLIADFVAESRAALAAAEAMLLELETDPHRIESVNTVFRAFHTVKGTSSFLGLSLITTFTHHAETLLSRMRDREIVCTGGYADLALRSVDTLRLLLDGVDDARAGGVMAVPRGYHSLLATLADPEGAGITGAVSEDTTAIPRLGDILVGFGRADRDAIEAALRSPTGQPAGLAIVQSGAASLTDVAHALRRQKHLFAQRDAEPSTRVRTDQLDRLAQLVGELVAAQTALAQDPALAAGAHEALGRRVMETSRIVCALEELSRATRMVPLRPAFDKIARVIQDVAHKTGKQVELAIDGEELEIDRAVLAAISDPLLHMARNAVDHGIEPADERAAAGKPCAGRVRLRAAQVDGHVIVELSDDGRGLDRDRLVRRALERGLIASAEGMSDRDILDLIFHAGFSTAETVTDISGRGVGMDAVRRGVESLRGRIDITSELGRGSTFSLHLPHGMTLTEGALVRVGEGRYVLPGDAVVASVRPEPGAVTVVPGGGESARWDGEPIPVLRLHRLLGVAGAVEDPASALLMVVGAGDERCALLVDELLGDRQVLARPSGDGWPAAAGVSGTALLDDGRVGLILDVPALTALAATSSGAA